MPFKSFALSPELLNAIHDQNYTDPTPIQQQTIPAILANHDLLASAQTGTGKTAAFALPILQKWQIYNAKKNAKNEIKKGKRPLFALILAPTRELAAQIDENIRSYSQYLNLRQLVAFGGVSINPQMMKLRGGVDIMIATPGRLLDLVQKNAVDLSTINVFVLDEADRMLDMGFIHDIRRIITRLPKKRQNLLFSATFSDQIKTLAQSFLGNPKIISVAKDNSTSNNISQFVHFVDKKRKRELLSYLIGQNQWHQVLIFTRTKYGANHLADQLNKDGIKASAIHGNKSQGARTRALQDFKNGQIRALVATDIAARGLDIEFLPYVVNYELPQVAEDYVHRIGRTGRAENQGKAISLVCIDEKPLLQQIEKLINQKISEMQTDGFAVDPTIKADNAKRATNKYNQNRSAFVKKATNNTKRNNTNKTNFTKSSRS